MLLAMCAALAALMLLSSIPTGVALLVRGDSPARTFSGKLGDINVTVKAPRGAFPRGVEMVLSPNSAAAGRVMSALEDALAVDISFYSASGRELQPEKPVTVTMTGKDLPVVQSVLHIADDGRVSRTQYADKTDGVTFCTDRFSTYILVFTDEQKTLTAEGETYEVTLTYGAEAFLPDDATLSVWEIPEGMDEYAPYVEQVQGLLNENQGLSYIKLLDLSILSEGAETEPSAPVQVSIRLLDKAVQDGETPMLLHFSGAPKLQSLQKAPSAGVLSLDAAPKRTASVSVPEQVPATLEDGVLTFTTDGFSVYAIAYTVDFTYTVNGKTFDFSLPGGGFIPFTKLMDALGVVDAQGEDASEEDRLEAVKGFVADIQSAEFSDPSLVWIGQVEESATVGQLKQANGLEPEYTDALTEALIAEMDAQPVEAGDWALISLKPFLTEESLTITMADGEVFAIAVADAQLQRTVITADGKSYLVTVTYDEDAHIPEDSTLQITEFAEDSEAYAYARNAVLADKKARGEGVDLDSFHLAALDISILDPNGEAIEPEAPVLVEIEILELPGVASPAAVAPSIEVQHHVAVADGVIVETVFDGKTEAAFLLNDEASAKGIAVDPNSVSDEDFLSPASGESDTVTASFMAPVFSTFTVTWSSSGTSQLRVSNLANGKYILYARDAANGNYYALVPGTALNSVQVTLNGGIVQYSGSENLYWDVEVSGGTYYFSFTEGGTKYYLAAGTTGNHVQLGTSKTGYGNASTTGWQQWSNYIHCAQDTFLQSYNGTFRTWNVAGQGGGWGDRSLIYFEKQGTSAGGNNTTVHYGYMDGTTFVEFDEAPAPTAVDTSHHAYLIYDFDGYQYAGNTYYRTSEAVNGANMTSGATSIQARLRYDSNSWQYYREDNGNTNNVADGSHIYVVYEKKSDVTMGGTPTLKLSSGFVPPDPPTITKSSTVNGDGTNTLALSVTGHTAEVEVEKLADVIVVFDISGSMATTDMQTDGTPPRNQTRLEAGRSAINALAEKLINKTNSYGDKLIRMSLITFSTDAQVVRTLTDVESEFKGAVNLQTTANGGTNWEKALMLANQMDVDAGRATFVIFVTDGDPTFRISRQGETDADLDMYSKDYDDTYYVSNDVFGEGNDDSKGNNYQAAKTIAESIVSHKKTLYTIAISSDVAHLNAFADDVGAAGKYTATSTAQLSQAFDDIASSILARMGHSDIQITDGISDLTQTVQKSTLVNFAEDDFTYYKGHAATAEDVTNGLASAVGEMVWEAWTPSSERCAEAVYDSTNGAVVWNMGEGFMLEEGYTYQVRFRVWPSQEAYDLLADLNNGVKSYQNLTDEEKAQIQEPTTPGGMYTLKTNDETSYTYREATKSGDTVTPTGEPSTPASFPDVDPLELTTNPLKVKKQWQYNYVDSRTLANKITLELYGVDSDGVTSHDFKEITLTKDGGWYAENNYISYGLVTYDETTDADEKIYETGHDFTLRETDDEAHYYELNAGVFRAMFINGRSTILERLDAAPAGMSSTAFHYKDSAGNHYYRFGTWVYRDTGSDVLLIATNSHRSFMDLNKVVVDESGTAAVDDTEFEYKITFTVPAGIANYETMEKYIWFSIYDSVARRTLSPDEYTYTNAQKPADIDSAYSGSAYADYLVAISGSQFTLKIKQGWNVRFLNLPNGATYSFEEVNVPTGYDFVKAEVSGTRWIANMVDGNDQGGAVDMSGLPANTSGSNADTAINGTIAYANARYNTTYTNRTITKQVQVLKTTQAGTTPLPGAVFSLYTASGYASDPKQPVRVNLTSGADGMVDLGKLAFGTYYLVETEAPAGYILLADPVVITVADTGVTYTQSNSNLSLSGGGILHEPATDAYRLTVTNDSGYALPKTGGSGTKLFYGLGCILLLGAGVLLIRRKRAI